MTLIFKIVDACEKNSNQTSTWKNKVTWKISWSGRSSSLISQNGCGDGKISLQIKAYWKLQNTHLKS